jgi:hypothetical protein
MSYAGMAWVRATLGDVSGLIGALDDGEVVVVVGSGRGRPRAAAGRPAPQLKSLQEEPTASTQAQLLDLGSYPLQAIPDMFSFDFYTHL